MPMTEPTPRRPRTRSWWPTPAGREALEENRRLCARRYQLTDLGRRALAERASAALDGRS